MKNAIDTTFIRLMVEKQSIYYISLGNIFGWFGEPYGFRDYITNIECKQNFDNKYLYGDESLIEAGSNGDLAGDYIFDKLYGVSFPYFSSSGFKSLCIKFNTQKTHYIKNVFNLVEHTYLHVVSDNSNDQISIGINGSNQIIEKIKRLFLKAMIDYNNKPIR